jgi:hypothetical protein
MDIADAKRLKELEPKLVEIGEDDGEQLLSGLLTRSEAPLGGPQ